MKNYVEISATDVRKNFADLMKRVAAGEVFVITKHGKAMASIVPAETKTPTLPENEQVS